MAPRSRGPAAGRAGNSPSLGAIDPRIRRTARAQVGAQDLAPPLYLDDHGRRALDVAGALFLGPDKRLRWRAGDGLEETPGSPTAARVKAGDDSVRVGKDGLRARPRASHVTNDSDAEGVTLSDVLNAQTAMLATHTAAVSKVANMPAASVAALSLSAPVDLLTALAAVAELQTTVAALRLRLQAAGVIGV